MNDSTNPERAAPQPAPDTFTATSATDKLYASARAQLAMKGFVLWRSDGRDGSVRFFIGMGVYCRSFTSLQQVIAFARQVGAA